MSERVTVALNDGLVDKLRLLAGGERKIGAYLSRLITALPDSDASEQPDMLYDELDGDAATLAAFVALGREIAALQSELQHARMRAYYFQQRCKENAEQEHL